MFTGRSCPSSGLVKAVGSKETPILRLLVTSVCPPGPCWNFFGFGPLPHLCCPWSVGVGVSGQTGNLYQWYILTRVPWSDPVWDLAVSLPPGGCESLAYLLLRLLIPLFRGAPKGPLHHHLFHEPQWTRKAFAIKLPIFSHLQKFSPKNHLVDRSSP